MPSHIFALHPTSKFFAKSFVSRNSGAKEGLKRDDPAGLGAGGPRFESGRLDQKYLPYFLQLKKYILHPKPHCGNPAGRRAGSVNNPIVEACQAEKIHEMPGRSAEP
jgi:hypothetical protein